MTQKERKERLAGLRTKLSTVFDEAGKEYDMSKVKCLGESLDSDGVINEITKMRKECDDLQSQIDEVNKAAESAKKERFEEAKKEVKANARNDRNDESDEKDDDYVSPARKRMLGYQIVNSAGYKLYRSTGSSAPFDVKADLNPVVTKDVFGGQAPNTQPDGWEPESIRIPGLVTELPYQEPMVIDVIPASTTTYRAVKFMKETTFDNAAAERTEGAVYAESEVVYTEASTPVENVGHFIPVTDEILEDVDGVEGLLNSKLITGLRRRVSAQLLNGNGTAPNLRGLMNTQNSETRTKGAAGISMIDGILDAIVAVQTTGFVNPNLIIMHPNNWLTIRKAKDRASGGNYLFGNPSTMGFDTLWGLRRVLTTEMTENTCLLGDFTECMQYVKKGVEVTVGYTGDDFTRGQRSIRARQRLALAVYRKSSFTRVTGLNV